MRIKKNRMESKMRCLINNLVSELNNYKFERNFTLRFKYGNEPVENNTPNVTVGGERIVTIHETFLSYLWCVCHTLWVLFEEQVAKVEQNIINKANFIIDERKVCDANELFEYAKILIVMYSDWDNNLPHPSKVYSDDKDFTNKTNGIFLYSISYIILHEIGHVEFNHEKSCIKNEMEADSYAFKAMLRMKSSDNRISIDLGILTGFCSLLFLKGPKSNSKIPTHPKTYERIDSIVKLLDNSPMLPHFGYVCVAIKLWDKMYSIGLDWSTQINDLKEQYNNLMQQLRDKNI